MKAKLRLMLPLALAAALRAQSPVELPPEAVIEKQEFHLSLIPKAFTRNPTMEITVNGELTPYGRTLPTPSASAPVYYVAHDAGFKPQGEAVAGEHPPKPEVLEQVLQQALRDRGYRVAADQDHPPTLALNFFWGSHNAVDYDTALMFPETFQRQMLERARLVGGRKYADMIARGFEFGTTILDYNPKLDNLRYQAAHELYYVVVSAYDFAALAKGERRLAWRTTMTVNSQGVSMQETLPPLIVSGGFFLGRETDEPVTMRRDVHRGSVKLGPLRIVQEDVPLRAK